MAVPAYVRVRLHHDTLNGILTGYIEDLCKN